MCNVDRLCTSCTSYTDKMMAGIGTTNLYSLRFLSGKCSHGGSLDRTSSREPTGGINKDATSSDHGFLHLRAAEMAINATMEVLQDIRLATGDQAFLRYET